MIVKSRKLAPADTAYTRPQTDCSISGLFIYYVNRMKQPFEEFYFASQRSV